MEDFKRLPDPNAARAQFAKLFKQLSDYIEAAKVQGFSWDKDSYAFEREDGTVTVKSALDQQTYLVLALRYKELFQGDDGGDGPVDVPFEIDGYLTEIDTGRIDADYMNENFAKWLKQIDEGEEAQATLGLLHGSFATLTQEQQRFAELVIHAAQRGELEVIPGKTFLDYINDFQQQDRNSQVEALVAAMGVNADKLRDLMARHPSADTINEYGRFEALVATCDKKRAAAYFAEKSKGPVRPFQVNMKLDKLLREFVIRGGIDV